MWTLWSRDSLSSCCQLPISVPFGPYVYHWILVNFQITLVWETKFDFKADSSPGLSMVSIIFFIDSSTLLLRYILNKFLYLTSWEQKGLPEWLSGKESACQSRRLWRYGFGPWIGRSPRGGHGHLLQYSYHELAMENPMNRGAWCVTVHGVIKSQTWLSLRSRALTHTHTHTHTANIKLVLSHFGPLWKMVRKLF